MLSLDSIDPFDSPEAKPYKTDPDILAMTSLLHVSTPYAAPMTMLSMLSTLRSSADDMPNER